MPRVVPFLLLLAAGCAPGPAKDDDTDVVDTQAPPIDLVTPLGEDEARAGVITDPAALIAGVSAEGRPGDILLINDRVRFVLQASRPASYYLTGWGGILDADVVRPAGEPGRELVEKWAPMFGLGRILAPITIEVIEDGLDGGPAHVRVEAIEAPLALLEGAVESPGLVQELGLEVVVDYVLAPGSSLLEVRSSVTAPTDVQLGVSHVIFGAPEVSTRWTEGEGRSGEIPGTFGWTGYIAPGGAVAATFAPEGELSATGGLDLVASLADAAIGGGPTRALTAGEPVEDVAWYGVARQLSTLTDEVLRRRGVPTTTLAGTVTDGVAPLAGVEVAVLVDDAPWTVAVSGADGAFAVQVPEGSAAVATAVSDRSGRFVDVPDAPPYAPYADASVRDAVLAELGKGRPRGTSATGRLPAQASDPLVLGPVGRVAITVDDGLPFAVRMTRQGGRATRDERLEPDGPGSGLDAAGWSRGGTLELAVEPGTWRVIVHRGMRFEVHQETVTVTDGGVATVAPSLPAAFEHPGWLLADPHSHASPSGDGEITMEDRLVVAAAVGIQVHFGTDHDHLADYRPLLGALGLDDVLATVLSDEVSPPLRGHMNIYPVRSDPLASNGGAYSWWDDIPTTTSEITEALRARHGADFVLQLNHPLDNGLGAAARWTPGRIGRSDYWSQDFQAVEVINAGKQEESFPFWLDLVTHGHRAAPVGVSDSHGHLGGDVGMTATWLGAGVDVPAALDDDTLVATLRGLRTQATRGPFLLPSSQPGQVVAPGATLTVEARSPSWIVVDRLLLLRDGVEVDRVDGTSATFTLDAGVDASFVVVAEGDAPMAPVTSRTPWAVIGPWFVDAGGDGWTPPDGPLVVP
ncbi:MAG: CehA/McbA family metallohydrolase [Alphaproteobacteria bacterium]|nr:CehA/McbA family metallohydrolase [Alphaproteobacteria bacterium]